MIGWVLRPGPRRPVRHVAVPARRGRKVPRQAAGPGFVRAPALPSRGDAAGRIRVQLGDVAARLDGPAPQAHRPQGRAAAAQRHRRPGPRARRLHRDARRAVRLVDEIVHDVTGLRAARATPRGRRRSPRSWSTAPNHIYIERAGKILRVDTHFLNDEHVLRIIDRIITPLGRRIDETSPRVDARLPDGSRVNAIIAPLSLVGPVITIRKFSPAPYTVDDLVRFGTATRRDVRVPAGLRRGQAQRLRVGRHGLRQDDHPQRPLVVHPERRADRHDRGRRRAPAPPGARGHPRGAPAEPRGRGRDHDPQPAAERAPHAPRPDHRRRVPRGRGARHAPGHDHRPRRLALDRPRQHARGTCSGASRR